MTNKIIKLAYKYSYKNPQKFLNKIDTIFTLCFVPIIVLTGISSWLELTNILSFLSFSLIVIVFLLLGAFMAALKEIFFILENISIKEKENFIKEYLGENK